MVRVLPATKRHLPGAAGIAFDFPRLWPETLDSAVSAAQDLAGVAKNAGLVSGRAKPFPAGIRAREQRRVRMSAKTGSSLNALEAVAAIVSRDRAHHAAVDPQRRSRGRGKRGTDSSSHKMAAGTSSSTSRRSRGMVCPV